MPRLAVPVTTLMLLLAGACERGDTAPPRPPDETTNADAAPGATANDPADAKPRPEACAELELEACAEQGVLALLSDTPEAAIPTLTWACEQDHAIACAQLAWSYRSGKLARPEPAVLHDLNLRGCAAGSPKSCGMLGIDYVEGEAVEQDLSKAAELFAQSCGAGDLETCSLLGGVLATEGEQQDLPGAAKAFAQACELGDTAMCKNAGVLYVSKLGQSELALPLFERGCAADDAEACYNLGAVHGDGLGVAPDLVVAEQWMRRACELGDQDGCAGAEQLAAAQDPNAIANANLSVGSMDVNGMTIQDLQCRMSGGGGGLFGSMALVATLADKKKALDKCAPKGAAPIVRWDFEGGKTKVVNVDDPSAQVAACIEKVMKKVPATMEAQCRATLLVGNKAGAEQAAAR
jgi:TPR repeat protein